MTTSLLLTVLIVLAAALAFDKKHSHRLYSDYPSTRPTNYIRVVLGLDLGMRGQMIIALFGESAPKIVQNFLALCGNENGASPDGINLMYEQSSIL